MQRNELQDLISKLEEREAVEESNLVMKFVKGIPAIFNKLIGKPIHKNLNLYYQNFCGLNTK